MATAHPKVIADRFQVISILGEGGIGYVYEAQDPVLAKRVAVKLLKQGLPPTIIVRFQNEAKAVGKFNHRNILDVFDFGIYEGNPYLVMEFLEGTALEQFVKEEDFQKFELSDLLHLFIQVCNGLNHAHKKNVLHRDVKPSNIMLTRDENNELQVKLVDFGIAKIADEDQTVTTTGAILGSPLYMSPEQIRAVNLDERTDIYSFGCVMYAIICGSPPFKAESAAETMTMHIKASPPPIPENFHDEQIPEALENLVMSCLEKNVEARPANFSEVRESLVEIISSLIPDYEYEDDDEDPLFTIFGQQVPRVRIPKGLIVLTALFIFLILGTAIWRMKNEIPDTRKAMNAPVIRKHTVTSIGALLEHHATIELSDDGKSFKAKNSTSDESLEVLSKPEFNNVTSANLRRAVITGKTLNLLQGKPLETVNLGDSLLLENIGLKHLSKCTTLKNLTISFSKCDNEGFKYLTKLKNLEHLYIQSKNVDDKTAEYISKLVSLKSLFIMGPSQLTDKGLAKLTSLKNLEGLSISGTKVSGEGLKLLKMFPKLMVLHLENLNLEDRDIDVISRLKILTVTLSNNQKITSSGFDKLGNLKRLLGLIVANTQFNDKNLNLIFKLKPIVLDISFTKVTPSGIQKISQLKKLENLNVAGLNLIDSDIRCLTNLKRLSSLNVHRNNLTDNSFESFARMPSLTHIQLVDGREAFKQRHGEETVVDNDAMTRGATQKFKLSYPKIHVKD